ncbi:hemin-degrading factor [Pontivivens ytuae]|uniref:Hemin-degrading factor n=1 Tax=Pontivivens ytuae TaxID=2789856 RepID=A0A7S9QDI5_9RHOB|nr:ChuX/HutX family heme-like substrate-binding protein [Pontivivens ytuae]QPH54171.1 hemin-degrading factor [Pontivivens ytuae]
MATRPQTTPEELRTALAEHPNLRPRDLAQKLGVSEADLVAAQVGHGATPIVAAPKRLIPAVEALGEVMALTRNDHVVHEKIGRYANFHDGDHAAMVLTEEIDLRIFPRHWVHAFAVERETQGAVRRSVQVFDAAGDAVHKVYLRDGSPLAAWTALRNTLMTGLVGEHLALDPRVPVEAAKGDRAKADTLRAEWDRMTDTHQFLRLTAKLKMNRLGAYRMVGEPHARALAPSSAVQLLSDVAVAGLPVMLFVGNRGCIQIHSGPIGGLTPMGPWQNVLDDGFNLHLRADRVAEVWAVRKPTKRGEAVSLEAFDGEGGLIFQLFGLRKEGVDHVPDFARLVDALPTAEMERAAS